MTLRDPNSFLSWQQLLAAYADGELDEAATIRVKAWLDEHPAAYREFEGQIAFSPRRDELWDSLQPPMPTPATWAGVWERVELSLDNRANHAPKPTRRSWWKRGLGIALLAVPCSAAAAVLALSLSTTPAPQPVPPAIEEPSPEVFEVAATNDVEILSVRDADVTSIVVGQPPLTDKMTLVARGDVKLESLGPAGDGTIPEIQMGGPSDAPMIYAPKSRTP
jgi:hypothetical protein